MKRLKMKELEELTGVSRETIRYYIRERLLPEPARPGRNVAWYDESFVERIGLIKDLQRRSYMPLRMIRAVLESDNPPTPEEAASVAALDGKLFAEGAVGLPTPETVGAAARRTGVAPSEIEALIRVGAARLEAAAPGSGDERVLCGSGVRAVEIWGELRAAGFSAALGFSPESIGLYVDFIGMLVREELRVFSHAIAGRVGADVSRAMGEAGIDKLGELLTVLRKETMIATIADFGLQAEVDRTGSD